MGAAKRVWPSLRQRQRLYKIWKHGLHRFASLCRHDERHVAVGSSATLRDLRVIQEW